MSSGILKRAYLRFDIPFLFARLLRFLWPFKGINWFLLLGTPVRVKRLHKEEKQSIFPAMKMRTEAPKSIHGPIHPNFCIEKYFPEVFLARIKDGISTYQGYNISSSGELMPELSVEAHFYPLFYPTREMVGAFDLKKYRIWNGRIRPPDLKFSGSVATLTSRWQRSYYHWLFEVLPRLHLLDCLQIRPDRLYIDTSLSFQKEMLNRLGYKHTELISTSDERCIGAAELIVPSVPGVPGVVPAWVCKYLREKFLPAASEGNGNNGRGPRLIYISRELADHRRFTNEEEITRLLDQYGFQKVFLENLRFQEQVDLLNGADVVVAAHGGGLSNIVFCRPRTTVIEIFSPSYVNPCYWHVSQGVDLRYYYILGEGATIIPEGKAWEDGAMYKDITLQIDHIEELLRSQLGEQAKGAIRQNVV